MALHHKYRGFVHALTSWRTGSVALLSFSSGLPLGLVWIAIPDWLRTQGVSLTWVGLFTIAQAPWSLKLLWAPLIDRYRLPFLGQRRGWIVAMQLLLALVTLILAGIDQPATLLWLVLALVLAMALASATQDIALDGYVVELLTKEEQAVAVGARVALYRAAMYVAGALTISLTAYLGWAWVCVILALAYVPMMLIAAWAPEPSEIVPQPTSLRDAVVLPLLELFSRREALAVLLFVMLYKLPDNLGQALLRPFLVDMGYSAFDRGVALGTLGLICTLLGTFLGGALTSFLGLIRSLWLFGIIQIVSNVGYVILALIPMHRSMMFAALGFETLTQGLGTGAFSVFLLRMTAKRFSVTQYALLTSLFAIPRIVSGPITGFSVTILGWPMFFVLTMVMGIPGLWMLQRFTSQHKPV